MNYLNLGCGQRFHSSWTNINFVSTGDDVTAHNLKHGIPFPDESFDVVYHSHVLEHFPKAEAKSFIKECYRVLRPKGILRVVVPDLEQIARTYLHCLEQASIGAKEWDQNYQWILLEMYDQTVRNQVGGEMINFLSKQNLTNQEFVVKRCGVEVQNIILTAQKQDSVLEPNHESLIKKLAKRIYCIFRYPDYRRQAILKLILSQTEIESLKIGQFRQGGEVHQWMYDHHSLKVLLQECGFRGTIQQDATKSYIYGWIDFNLDTEPDKMIYKPDSIFMEAIK